MEQRQGKDPGEIRSAALQDLTLRLLREEAFNKDRITAKLDEHLAAPPEAPFQRLRQPGFRCRLRDW